MEIFKRNEIMCFQISCIILTMSSLLIYKCSSLEVSNQYPDLYQRNCMVVAENNYSTLVMTPNVSKCPLPDDCWKSQLLVLSKANLTWYYNSYRNEIAQNNSLNGMIKVNWHWMLEIEAMKILRDCPDEGAAIIETRDVPGLDYGMSCEESILTISLNFNTQMDFVNYFPKLLRVEKLEKGEYFELPSVSHFGCAVIFVKSPKSARLVCLYCAKANRLSSDSACPYQYTKYNNSEFPYLCTHEFQKSIYGCEPEPGNVLKHGKGCSPKQPAYWKPNSDESTTKMYAVTDGNNFFIYVDRNTATKNQVGTGQPTILKCEEQGGQCAPLLPAYYYIYEDAKLVELNQTIWDLTHNTTLINYGTYNVDIQIAQIQGTFFEKASCCSVILIFFVLAAIPTAVIMYFTYKHHKQHPE